VWVWTELGGREHVQGVDLEEREHMFRGFREERCSLLLIYL
jgi:hypothetical protein